MNKHLNNWLDKVEGLPENTSNNNIMKEMARQLGSKGGKKSAESRFKDKTKEEKSELMRKVRYSKKNIAEMDIHAKEYIKALNQSQQS